METAERKSPSVSLSLIEIDVNNNTQEMRVSIENQ